VGGKRPRPVGNLILYPQGGFMATASSRSLASATAALDADTGLTTTALATLGTETSAVGNFAALS
jgi:hypothetical protein